MRRNDIPALPLPEQAVDNISLLIGARADRERRRSSQISAVSHEALHRRFSQLFSGQTTPGNDDTCGSDGGEDEDEDSGESGPGFLGHVDSYRRLMHRHTKSQMESPAIGTVPSYSKTMHAFMLNQLHHQQRLSKSETSSPHIGVGQAFSPSNVRHELSRLSEDEQPRGPSNTPEQHSPLVEDVQGIDFRKLKRSSVTEPTVSKGVADVKSRDFGAARV